MYPARVPKQNTTQYLELQKFSSFPPGEGRTALMQGMYQLGGLVCTLAVAIFGGVLTGRTFDQFYSRYIFISEINIA